MDPDDLMCVPPTRPFYKKVPGEVGIFIDFVDVTPVNKNEYGSLQYMNMDFLEKLYDALSKVPFYKIKGALCKKNLTQGMILEKWHKGVVLAVSFDTPEDAERAYQEYGEGQVAPIIEKFLHTKELLKGIGASSIKLRARMWKDECEACLTQMESSRLKDFTLKEKMNDRMVLREVKDYQKEDLYCIVKYLKTSYSKLDKKWADFTLTLKQNLPIGVNEINTYDEFMIHYKKIKAGKKDSTEPFDIYNDLRRDLLKYCDEIEENIYHRLMQVHLQCHTEHQLEVRDRIKCELEKAREWMKGDFMWSSTRCPEWRKKVLRSDHGLLLGLISVISYGLDAVYDVDHMIDAYMSGIDWDIKI